MPNKDKYTTNCTESSNKKLKVSKLNFIELNKRLKK